MIDTIAIVLASHEFKVINPEKFSPCASDILAPPYPRFGSGKTHKRIQNPSKTDIKEGIYKPRLTLMLRPCRVTKGMILTLKIELSAPKFMRGNNFEELTDDDFELFCVLLSLKLKMMGVEAGKEAIASAQVSIIHYSKNFILDDHVMCRHVLDALKKTNVFPRLDATEKDYRNNGHMIKWHANNQEVCMYDKIKDLRQARISEKRAFEKDQYSQVMYLDALLVSKVEVLRYEVRLHKTKIKSLFKKIGIAPIFTLKRLFSSKISKQILTYYWNLLTGQQDLLDLLQMDMSNHEEYLDNLQHAYPNKKPKDLMSIMGTSLVLQQLGEAGLRAVFPESQQRSARRLIDHAKNHQPKSNTRWIATQQIGQKLIEFKQTRLEGCIKDDYKITK